MEIRTMATAGVLATRPRWAALDRILIIILLVVFTLGAPGLGFETRQAPESSIADAAYGLMFLLPLAALLASWKWAVPAAWLGVVGSIPPIVASVLDLFGVLIGPPPATMVAVDAGIVIAGLAVAMRCWRVARA
jgi:hypothetical protein